MSAWSSRLRLRESEGHFKPYFALGANTVSSWSSRLRLRELRAHYKPYFALGANTMSSWSNRLRLKEPRAQSLLSTLQRKPSTSF